MTRNMETPKLKIIIVDDSEPFRKGLKQFLETECNYRIIAEASNGNDFLDLKNIYCADIILMDLMMPGKGGYETAFETTSMYRDAKIIAITNHLDFTYLMHILQSGFKACVFKENIFEEIVFAIKKVIEGEYYVPEKIKM